MQEDEQRIRAAAELYAKLTSTSSLARLLQAIARDRRSVWTAIRFIEGLPRVRVEVTATPAGREIAGRLGRRRFMVPTGCWAVATLVLPADPAAYFQGRHRQALRTNLRRADTEGLGVVELVGPDMLGAVGAVLDVRRQEGGSWTDAMMGRVSRLIDDGAARVFAACDDAGARLALAVVVVDRRSAHLVLAVTTQGRREGTGVDRASAARWALHAGIVRRLCEASVRVYVVDTVFRHSAGSRYFQRLVGFEPCNLQVRRGA
jgi:hypothetical protein